ncbi:unnamed protein product [Lactuca saligna]|uniref:F-box associated beta-propeller type 3 domain-containing protein n=1 Tax=Lactuca saligna TaxID=75948 RepID=A0AA35VD08_LACSI|nr:unnamed protein product [Lactuca saligna]
MRCASKSWNALLSQSSFVKSHLHHSIHNNTEILLVFTKDYFYFHCEPFIAHPNSRSPHLKLINFIKIPNNPPSQNIVIGSVDDLVCFSHRSDDYLVVNIWNPSLSTMLTLPSHSMHSNNYNDSMEIIFWFGYEPETKDYRVVMLNGIHQPPSSHQHHVIKEWRQVEVYNMKSGSWKLITQRFPSYVSRIHPQHEVCVDCYNGHLHWLCYIDEKMKAQKIVTFDLGAETFHETHLLDSILD